MLVVFSPIFMAGAKIIYGHNSVATLSVGVFVVFKLRSLIKILIRSESF